MVVASVGVTVAVWSWLVWEVVGSLGRSVGSRVGSGQANMNGRLSHNKIMNFLIIAFECSIN